MGDRWTQSEEGSQFCGLSCLADILWQEDRRPVCILLRCCSSIEGKRLELAKSMASRSRGTRYGGVSTSVRMDKRVLFLLAGLSTGAARARAEEASAQWLVVSAPAFRDELATMVTFNFPKRVMYLKRTSVGPFMDENSSTNAAPSIGRDGELKAATPALSGANP